jgi:hypothetical protein
VAGCGAAGWGGAEAVGLGAGLEVAGSGRGAAALMGDRVEGGDGGEEGLREAGWGRGMDGEMGSGLWEAPGDPRRGGWEEVGGGEEGLGWEKGVGAVFAGASNLPG